MHSKLCVLNSPALPVVVNFAPTKPLDLQELFELYKNKAPKQSKNDMGNYDSKDGSNLKEQKVRKAIRKLIRQ